MLSLARQLPSSFCTRKHAFSHRCWSMRCNPSEISSLTSLCLKVWFELTTYFFRSSISGQLDSTRNGKAANVTLRGPVAVDVSTMYVGIACSSWALTISWIRGFFRAWQFIVTSLSCSQFITSCFLVADVGGLLPSTCRL